MEIEDKQRNTRRKRARRMQQELELELVTNSIEASADESEIEDDFPKKPPRPPNLRKKNSKPCEEDIVEGFSILQFRSCKDLRLVLELAARDGIKRLSEIERSQLDKLEQEKEELEKLELEAKDDITNHILVHTNHNGLTLIQDPLTSDDSGRASGRLTGSTGSSVVSVAPRERDADSSRDRLSDASSRCSSGKGYICDSEGEDDKGSDASSVIFPSVPSARKHEFPGALPPSLPQSLPHGPGNSPVPAPTPPNIPAPSPAPAQQPPHHLPQAILQPSATVTQVMGESIGQPQQGIKTEIVGAKVPVSVQDIGSANLPPTGVTPVAIAPQQPPPPLSSMPPATAPIAPPAAAPVAHHPSAPLDPSGHTVGRTDSPAVATSANAAVAPSPGQYHHSFQPLYAPYAHTAAPSYPNSIQYPATTAVSTATAISPIQQQQQQQQHQQQQPHQQQQQQPITTQPQPLTHIHPVTVPHNSNNIINNNSNNSSSHQTPSCVIGQQNNAIHHPEPPKRALSPQKPILSNSRSDAIRESYSVTSLCRSSVPTTIPTQIHPGLSQQPSATVASANLAPSTVASTLAKPWPSAPSTVASSTRLSPTPSRQAQPIHNTSSYASSGAPPPLFAPPPLVPPSVSRESPLASSTSTTTNPNPFSAESLFQTNQADMLRRELDNRFLASQDRTLGVAPAPPYLRTEMHQHQHHHTHVHQHTTSLLPPPTGSALFPGQLPLSPLDRLARGAQSSFKDIPKLGAVDSPFYRQGLGMPGYPAYNAGLIGHPGITTGSTPFVPPNHLPTFQPKSLTPHDSTKPKVMKAGKWNAMHVRVAWEIYHSQGKTGEAKGAAAAAAAAAAASLSNVTSKQSVHSTSDLLRGPSHLFSPGIHTRPPDLTAYPPSALSSHRPVGFDQSAHHPGSLFGAPPGHLGKSPFSTSSSLSPFTRYAPGPLGGSSSPFSVSPFAAARDAHLGLGPLHHDPWRTMQRTLPGFPSSVNPLPPNLPGLPPGPTPWSIKADPVLEQREREAREERERERLRREREERERREREEKQRRLEQQVRQKQQERERERERREKERREMERRENERRERERERERELLLHQQRLAAETAAKQASAAIRDRSPLRNGHNEIGDVRIKEEPRTKDDDLLARTDARYHPYLRLAGTIPGPPSALDRSRMLAHALPPHYPPAATHWPPSATLSSDFYRYAYNPLMEAMRPLDDRAASYYSPYGPPPTHHPSQLRPKDPSLLHLRGGPGPPHKMSITPPTDLHKKEEPR